MIKILLCFAIIVLCGAIGYGISNFYILRKKFFFCFSNFLITLKNDISFGLYNLVDIINKNLLLNYQSKDFKILLTSFKNNISEGLNEQSLFNDIKILTTQEKNSIFCFFNSLGKTDIKNQIEEVEKFIEINNLYFNEVKEESKKYCSLYTKLGVIMGAFVAILII